MTIAKSAIRVAACLAEAVDSSELVWAFVPAAAVLTRVRRQDTLVPMSVTSSCSRVISSLSTAIMAASTLLGCLVMADLAQHLRVTYICGV